MNDVLVLAGTMAFIAIMVGWGIPAAVRAYRIRRFRKAVLAHFGPRMEAAQQAVADRLFGDPATQDLVAQLGNETIDKFAKDLVRLESNPVEENRPEENRGNQAAG